MDALGGELARFAHVDQQDLVCVEGGLYLGGGQVLGLGGAEHRRVLLKQGGQATAQKRLDRVSTTARAWPLWRL